MTDPAAIQAKAPKPVLRWLAAFGLAYFLTRVLLGFYLPPQAGLLDFVACFLGSLLDPVGLLIELLILFPIFNWLLKKL